MISPGPQVPNRKPWWRFDAIAVAHWVGGAAVAASFVGAAAGCSGGDDSLASREVVQGSVIDNEKARDTDTVVSTSQPDGEPQETEDRQPDDEVGSPPTTEGSGLPPVTTIPGPVGADPDGIYQGVLGSLGVSEVVADPIAEPPAGRAGVLPLTGLAGQVPDRPAAVVKIDNGPAAGPQTGLNSADIVIEEEVEGGVTRFATIFHSTSSIIGPVRSGRTSDVGLISSLGEPLYLYSGANDITEMIIRRQSAVQNRSYSSSSGYWRDESRQAPSNVYSDTAPHWASADGASPAPQFAYRPDGEVIGGQSVSEFAIGYPASPVRWVWQDETWVRHQRGQRHDLVSGQPVTAANVVVVEVDRVATGMVDSAGGQVPESVFVGTGPATVFSDGQKTEGRWTRPTLSSVATLTDDSGEVIKLTPGRTWIQLIELGSGALQ